MHESEKEILFEKIRISGRAEVRVGGYCMKPVIQNGAMVCIKTAKPETLEQGDLLAYFIGNNLYVHRLVSENGKTFRLCADNHKPDEHTVPASDILGKVVKITNPSIAVRICHKILNYIRFINTKQGAITCPTPKSPT